MRSTATPRSLYKNINKISAVALGFLGLLNPSPARAEVSGTNANLFVQATGGPVDYLSVRGASVLPRLSPTGGGVLSYAHRPLVFDDGNGGTPGLIEHQLNIDAVGAITVIDQLQIGVGLPITLYQTGEGVRGVGASDGLSGAAAGDLRIDGRWAFGEVGVPDLHLAALLDLTLPTGQAKQYVGNGFFTFRPGVVAEWKGLPDLRFAAEMGYLVREQLQLDALTVGNEITWGLAAGYTVQTGLDVLGELIGRIPLDGDHEATADGAPVELRGAARYALVDAHLLTAGLGIGVNTGYGAPAVRLFAGYTFAGANFADRDKDGIADAKDACPDEPEDFDAFEDLDGCPDPDNDHDSILDAEDLCPNAAEDRDGYQDEDGCPDPDNDGDKVLDADDACPNEPGPAEQRGCPTADRDGDGIADDQDRCPDSPEDRDGFQDEDGCPDHDNDLDGILDTHDQCPNDAETPNGFEDEDGCPDNAPEVETVRITEQQIEVSERVPFKFGTAELTPAGKKVIDKVADALLAHPELNRVEIQGHTDVQGAKALNAKLSQDRADSVKRALVSRGVGAERLSTKGFGSRNLLDEARTLEAHQKNRRVEFHILERKTP
jgi:outer membrane protein OmpA-like peptidoglycan-associated protein